MTLTCLTKHSILIWFKNLFQMYLILSRRLSERDCKNSIVNSIRRSIFSCFLCTHDYWNENVGLPICLLNSFVSPWVIILLFRAWSSAFIISNLASTKKNTAANLDDFLQYIIRADDQAHNVLLLGRYYYVIKTSLSNSTWWNIWSSYLIGFGI